MADRVPERLARIVLLDGVVVEPGQPGFAGLPPEVAQQRRSASDGVAYPPPPASAFGVSDPDDLAWISHRLTAHPLRTYSEPFPIAAPLGNGVPVTYISCTDPPYPAVHSAHAIAAREGWNHRELATGHDAMITAPALTAEALLRA